LKLESRLSIADVIPLYEGKGEKMHILSLEDMSILENEFYGMTEIASWLLMTIAKKSSTHSGSLLLDIPDS
jgi:hypothetical protein